MIASITNEDRDRDTDIIDCNVCYLIILLADNPFTIVQGFYLACTRLELLDCFESDIAVWNETKYAYVQVHLRALT